MKKKTAAILCIAALFAVTGGATAETYDMPEEYRVPGGKVVYDFSGENDINDFSLYTEFDKKPAVVDGKIVCWSLAEQKIVYKNAIFSDVDVSVDIGTINKNGKFDAGIYLGITGETSGKLDGITGYCVNLERTAGETSYRLKLHKFDHRYEGALAEKSGLILHTNEVRLRAVIKNKVLYAFAGDDSAPKLIYAIGNVTGRVGLRSFYAPDTFDNIEITGAALDVDTAELSALAERARDLAGGLTASSRAAVESALAAAEEAISFGSVYEIDEAISLLDVALKNAVVRRDYDTLVQWIAEADEKTNTGEKYTANSWAAFCKVKDMCKTLTEDSGEDEISYWANRLRLRLDNLIDLRVTL